MATEHLPVISDLPIPPGEILAEEIEARGLSPQQIASQLDWAPVFMDELIAGQRAITEEIALALSDLLGISASFWINLECDYRLSLVRAASSSWATGSEWIDASDPKSEPDSAEGYALRGNALMDAGRFEDAIGDYNNAIHLNGSAVEAYINRGNAKRSLRRVEEALADFNTAVHLDPQAAHAYGNRGSALVELGRVTEAVSAFEKALELCEVPKDTDYRYRIELALDALNLRR